LDSIKKQDFNDYEIIVADAGSEDKTLDVAKKYGCRITGGGLPGAGRNKGARVARGELFLFLDADVALPKKTLKKILSEFRRRKLDIATFPLLPFKKAKTPRIFFTFFYNLPIIALEKVLPHAAMGILIKREVFEGLGGFDETIKLAEDNDLARRAVKIKKRFGVLKSTKLLISDRRFRTDGWVRSGIKYLLSEVYAVFIGPIRSDIFKYRFNHYKKDFGGEDAFE